MAQQGVDIIGGWSGDSRSIAEHIADVIVAHGVGVLSHRIVAQVSGIASSSIAHHYPGHRDLLLAGVEALYRRMRSDLRAADIAAPSNADVIRLTHESALTALNNPAFLPFAIDMRRRRAENVHAGIAASLGMPPGSDRARTQAVVMAIIGDGLANLATGRAVRTMPDFLKSLG